MTPKPRRPKPPVDDAKNADSEIDSDEDLAEIQIDASNKSFMIRMGRSDIRLLIWWTGIVLVFALILSIIGSVIYFLHLIGFHVTQIGWVLWVLFCSVWLYYFAPPH